MKIVSFVFVVEMVKVDVFKFWIVFLPVISNYAWSNVLKMILIVFGDFTETICRLDKEAYDD